MTEVSTEIFCNSIRIELPSPQLQPSSLCSSSLPWGVGSRLSTLQRAHRSCRYSRQCTAHLQAGSWCRCRQGYHSGGFRSRPPLGLLPHTHGCCLPVCVCVFCHCVCVLCVCVCECVSVCLCVCVVCVVCVCVCGVCVYVWCVCVCVCVCVHHGLCVHAWSIGLPYKFTE